MSADLHQQLLTVLDERIKAIEQLGEQNDGMVNVVYAVVELHEPEIDEWDARCTGCLDAYGESSQWPCLTVRTIAREMGIEVAP